MRDRTCKTGKRKKKKNIYQAKLWKRKMVVQKQETHKGTQWYIETAGSQPSSNSNHTWQLLKTRCSPSSFLIHWFIESTRIHDHRWRPRVAAQPLNLHVTITEDRLLTVCLPHPYTYLVQLPLEKKPFYCNFRWTHNWITFPFINGPRYNPIHCCYLLIFHATGLAMHTECKSFMNSFIISLLDCSFITMFVSLVYSYLIYQPEFIQVVAIAAGSYINIPILAQGNLSNGRF